MNNVTLLDLDNTMCEAKKPMDEGFAQRFSDWAESNTFIIVTGGTIQDVICQVPDHILSSSHLIFCSSGNSVYSYEREENPTGPYASYNSFAPKLIKQNEFDETQELIDLLEFELKYSTWGTKFGNHIERRLGALNFSIVGRNANDEWRQKYYEYDLIEGERKRICNAVNERFEQYDCTIGGKISCDIVMKGCDKSQVIGILQNLESKYKLDHTSHSFTFYGDRCNVGENDYSLATMILENGYGNVIPVQNWQDLQEKLGLTPAVQPVTVKVKNGKVSTGD